MKAPAASIVCFSVVVGMAVLGVTPAAAQPIPGTSESQTFGLIAGGLALVFAAVGGLLLYVGIRNRNLAKASETWPTAGGKVLSADVVKRRSKDRKTGSVTTHYRPQIRYSYKVTDVAYESDVIRFGNLEGGLAQAEEFTGKYPIGATVAVRYNPDNPKQATLESVSAGGQQILLGAVFLAVPFLILFIGAVILLSGGGPELPPGGVEQSAAPN